jgi:hypothetical protein
MQVVQQMDRKNPVLTLNSKLATILFGRFILDDIGA